MSFVVSIFPVRIIGSARTFGAAQGTRLKTTKKPLNPSGLNEKNGAGDEIRTHDIHLGKVALYH